MTCPDPTLGTVTNPTGSISGTSYADLVDACSIKDGYSGQWQWYALLSSKAGVGARYRANQVVKGEHRFWPTMIAGVTSGNYLTETAPPPPCPITFQLDTTSGASPNGQTINGVSYELNANSDRISDRCKQTAQAPTAGTVTFTRFDDTVIEAAYDLQFGTDHITGSFIAPRLVMDGCPARPSTRTCV